MTALPDPNALLQMARSLGLHPVVTHAPDSEVIAAVRVYRTELDNRAVVTWEATGLVRRDGPSWVPCSRAEAAAALEAASVDALSDESSETEAEYWRRLAYRVIGDREALRDIIARCLAKVPGKHGGCLETAIDLLLTEWRYANAWCHKLNSQANIAVRVMKAAVDRTATLEAERHDAENAVATAQIDAECSGIEACGCDDSRWWEGHAAYLSKRLKEAREAVAEAKLQSNVSTAVARWRGRAHDELGRDLQAAEEEIRAARDNAQHWEREAARLAKELKAALAENEQLHDALAAAHEPSAQCGGPGTCHGTMRWCDSCGDVGAVCDAVACDVHARPQRF